MLHHQQDLASPRHSRTSSLTGALSALGVGAAGSVAAAELPVILSQQTLVPSPAAEIASAAIDGNTIVLGAPYDASLGEDTGAVIVFERPPGGAWVQTAWLQSSTAAICQRFGVHVDVEGDTLVANHWHLPRLPDPCSLEVKLSGLHAFERTGAGWTQTLNTTGVFSPLGSYLASDGTSLLNAYEASEAVALTRDSSGNWSAPQELDVTVSNPDADFETDGMDVAVHDGFAAIGGAYRLTGDHLLPAATLLERATNGEWQRLGDVRVAPGPGRGDEHWIPTVRVSIGPQRRLAIDNVVFEPDGSGQYVETAELQAPCVAPGTRSDVKLDNQGDLALVRTFSRLSGLSRRGSTLHLFTRQASGEWTPTAQLVSPQHDALGSGFAIDSGMAVSGHHVWDTTATSASWQFSAVDDCPGHRGNWVERTPQRWDIDGGAYRIITSDYSSQSGDRPGEYALFNHHEYSDFDLTLKARSDESLSPYSAADYVVIFGYQGEDDYYYMMFSRYAPNNELFRVVNGVRQQIARAPGASFTDNGFHQVEIRRRGSQIQIRFDGNDYLQVTDATFTNGAIGIGSFNDAVSFDDISVSQPVAVDLGVNSSAAGAGLWSLQENLQPGDLTYADRTYPFASVPADLQGAIWIRPAATSKSYTGEALAAFTITAEADVYIGLDVRTTPPPAWLSGWTATGATLSAYYNPDPSQPIVYTLYRKRFPAGSRVTLGNNGSTSQPTYIPIIKPVP